MGNYWTVIFFLFFPFLLSAQEPVFTATTNRSTVKPGENFQLTYKLEDRGSDFKPPSFDDFQVLGGPMPGFSTVNINGKVTRSQTFTYYLRALKEGEFTISPATIRSGGKLIRSNPLTIKVTGGEENEAGEEKSENIFVRTFIDNPNPYRGQQIKVTHKLYSKVSLAQLRAANELQYEGFWNQPLDNAQREQQTEQYQGENYMTLIVNEAALFPQKTGELRIAPFELEGLARVKTQQRRRSTFDDFFDDPFSPFGGYRNVQFSVKSPSAVINVKPLPEKDKPTDFSGLTGNFSMNSEVSSAAVDVNESINLKITISGKGNIKLIPTPEIKAPPVFDIYDPKEKEILSAQGTRISGSKIYEYVIVPRRPGSYKIEEIKFSFFDPDREKYITLTEGPFNVEVRKTPGYIEAPGEEGSDGTELIRTDINFIRTNPEKLKKKEDEFPFSAGFWTLSILPFLLIGGSLIFRKREKEKQGEGFKKSKAYKKARKKLNSAIKAMGKTGEKTFYSGVASILWTYASEKLLIPAADLSKENVSGKLVREGASLEGAERFVKVIEEVEIAQFAPSLERKSPADIHQEAIISIDNLEKEMKA